MKQLKRKYRKTRTEFKRELRTSMAENKALAMLVIETYTAWKHKDHIVKIWAMFQNPAYQDFHRDYSDNLMGKYLSGRIDIWRSFHFAEYQNLYAYKCKIPEKFAMGDALGVAYETLRRKKE